MLNKKNKFYIFVSIISLILSILWIIFVNTKPSSDFQYYNTVARQVANGGQWGDTYTSVGYAIVLGFVYKLFGLSIMVGKIFNIFLSALSFFILFKLLKKVELEEKKRKIIFTIFAFFPNTIFYNSLLCTEILFTTIFLFIGLLYFSDFKYKYIFIGILTGINAMIKPFFLIFFFAVFMIQIVNRVGFLKTIKNTLVVLLFSALTLSPWIYRNTKLIGQFTTISNNGGIVLYINNNSQNNAGRWMPAANVKDSLVNQKKYKDANPTERNNMLSSAAKKWILSHPLQFIDLGFKRIYNTYYIADDIAFTYNGTGLSTTAQNILANWAYIYKMIIFIPATVMVIIKCIEVIKSLIKKKTMDNFMVYNLICYFMFACTYFITEGQGRYSFPAIIIMTYFFTDAVFRLFFNKAKGLNKI